MRINSLLKNAGIMFFATAIANVFTLLYQLFMIRALVPSDFGLLDKLLGLTLLTSMPMGSFQAVVTKFISSFKAENNFGKIYAFLWLFLKKLGILGIITLITFVVFRNNIAAYYKTENTFLIVMVGLLLIISTVLPLNLGALQGLQKFKSLGTASILSSFLRLILGVVFVKIGFKVAGALMALIIASITAFLVAFIPLRKYFLFKEGRDSKSNDYNLDLKEIYKYCLPAFIAMFSFALLTNMDLQLISPFFSKEDAGYFALARMLGKIILYLPGAVTIVMFPKVSEYYTLGRDTSSILKKCLLIVGAICFFSGLVCAIFPELILNLLVGKVYPQCIPLVLPFVTSMGFYALSSVFLYYYLSILNMKFIYICMGFACLQAALILFFHSSLLQVLYILVVCSIALFLINILGVKKLVI
ncbi:MAG: oligosaccharide flippase family protein [Candidatus Omnitrophota bacterium]